MNIIGPHTKIFRNGIITPTSLAREIVNYLVDPEELEIENKRARLAASIKAATPMTAEEKEINARFESGYYDGGPGGPITRLNQ